MHLKCEFFKRKSREIRGKLILFDNNQDKFLFTQLEEIKAYSQMKFKIRFQPMSMRKSFLSAICNGLIKITAIDHELRFNVQMIGFIGKSYIFVDNLMKQSQTNNFLTKIN